MASVACASPGVVSAASSSCCGSQAQAGPGVGAGNAAVGGHRRWESKQLRAGMEAQQEALQQTGESSAGMKVGLVGALAAVLVAGASPVLADSSDFQTYYGTAASASSYGGYGGNANKRDSAEYTFEVPQGWKERLISKVEKGTNGTDTEFFNPRRKGEKVYLTFLSGFRQLAPRDTVLNNLALSDVNLQDIIASAEDIKSFDRKDGNGQTYYDYEIDSPVAHGLISVTCAKNKLYAHFVKAPSQDWSRDETILRHIHESFQTV